jgi:hypothetical protein
MAKLPHKAIYDSSFSLLGVSGLIICSIESWRLDEITFDKLLSTSLIQTMDILTLFLFA